MIRQIVDRRTITLIFAVGLFLIGVADTVYALPSFSDEGDTATRSVDENASVPTDVGASFPVDTDGYNHIKFEFPDYNNKFEYVIGTNNSFVQIKTKVRLNYEVQNSYTVRLIMKIFDGNLQGDGSYYGHADTVPVTINVNDVAERPTLPLPSSGDALHTLTSKERERITSLLTLDTVIFNELFNAENNSHDWLELRNVTNETVDLSGWHLIVVTDEITESLVFPAGTVLPAGELLLFLNTDPNAPEMPLAVSDESSYHYIVDDAFTLPQEDFMLLLRSPSAWEDNAGSYLFGEDKTHPVTDFTLDTAWFRTKSTVLGHHADAWVPSGYRGGLGYDNETSEDFRLGTPRYPHETLVGDANGDGSVNILDLVLVASASGKSGDTTADINSDGIVNIQDLVVIANGFGSVSAAPSAEALTTSQVEQWLKLAKHAVSTHPIQTSLSEQAFSYERGIQVLEQFHRMLLPKETTLLANYPNPFNPETWIPYQLAKASDVNITIYDTHGTLVRQYDLGHQAAGSYQSRSRAVYWDGTNALGEAVASDVYFYTLTTDDFSATRRMLILK